jgi:hypothetical protein
MTTRLNILLAVLTAMLLVAGCSQEQDLAAPGSGRDAGTKNGTEVLGPPSITIAAGTGFAEAGVGMANVTSGQLTVDVPEEAQVVQALLYWAGGTNVGAGDAEISLDGNLIQGELIGGPTLFFADVEFFAYRADITDLELIGSGSTTLTVADFNFPVGNYNENNGAAVLVIYDDGTGATITLRDGLDMAYFGFEPTLDATVPQTFAVEVGQEARNANLVILTASVGENRPTSIQVTTVAGVQMFENILGGTDGEAWDSLTLPIEVPAGADEVVVQIVSTPSTDPRGASLGWVAAGLAVEPAAVETFIISGVVFEDASQDAFYDGIEWGIGGVVVELNDANGTVATATTTFFGEFQFEAPAGNYTVDINLTGYPDDFNADLAAYFDATMPLSSSVTIGPDNSDSNFGFTPLAEELAVKVENGELPSNGKDLKYWKTLFRRALIEEGSNRQGNGHDDGGVNDNGDGGWGHDETYASPDDLRGFLTAIEGYYIQWPYQFTDGMELEEVYDILASKPSDDEGKLFVELLVTELNFAAGFGLIDEADVLGVLISWGESLLAAGEKSVDKDRRGDLKFALELFAVINTGGGGGVDE